MSRILSAELPDSQVGSAMSPLGFSTQFLGPILALVTLTTILLVPAVGLHFPAADWLQPLAICTGLLVAALYYRARQAPSFVLCLKALTVLVWFSTVFAVLMYAVAATARPLADSLLASADASLGFHAPRWINWVEQQPGLRTLLWLCYFSVIPQTALTIVYLGLTNRQQQLDDFLRRFMLCGMLTVVGFYFLPALGTCSFYHLEVPSHYQPILDHLEAVRSGAKTVVTYRDAEGLIVFPSFHTVWGILLILAYWPLPALRWPMLAWNGLMISSTIPIGMHYLTDVIGGTVVCAAVVAAERGVAYLQSKERLVQRPLTKHFLHPGRAQG